MATKRPTRNFHMSDAAMLSSARVFATNFEKNSAPFSMLDDITFHPDFYRDFENQISKTEAIPSDDVLIDEQSEQTEDVNHKLEECIDEIRFAKYFINKGFKGRATIINQFGYNDLDKVRYSSNKMILFMEDFAGKIAEHATKLIDARYPEDKIHRMAQLTEELKIERNEQASAKLNRALFTERRINQMNMIWHSMALIADAAEFAPLGDESLRAVFRLPSGK